MGFLAGNPVEKPERRICAFLQGRLLWAFHVNRRLALLQADVGAII
jgi:hypothetical protein